MALLEAVASAELGIDGDPVPDEDLRAYLAANDIPVPGAAETSKVCGSFDCTLPAGHNMGRPDVPENHSPAAETEPSG